ncbi:MAG: hypothetical protein AAFR81_19525 [Chloroflexota bacterium]
MALVWQSSVFWIAICAALLVLVGCSVYTLRSQPVTATPMPMSSYQPILASTALPPDFFYPTLQNQVAISPDRYTFVPSGAPPGNIQLFDEHIMRVEPPICYLATQDSVACMGRVWNESDSTLGDTALRVNLQAQDADNTHENEILVHQRRIEPNDFAPYHTMFHLDEVENDAYFDLSLADLAVTADITQVFEANTHTQMLSVQDSRGMLTDNGQYYLTATILNNTPMAVENMRLIVTLNDAEWGIVGYRVHEVVDMLDSGAERLVQVAVIPYRLPERIVHHIHVEADAVRE